MTGKKVTEKGLVKRVVQELLEPFEKLNHVVYLDNFFTSGPLVDVLAKKGIYTVGTIQRRAAGFPTALKKVSPAVGEYSAIKVTIYYYSTQFELGAQLSFHIL